MNVDANVVASFVLTILKTGLLTSVQLIVSAAYLYRCSPLVFVLAAGFSVLYAAVYLFGRQGLYGAGLCFKDEQSEFFGKVESALENQRFIFLNALIESVLISIDSFYTALFRAAAKYQSKVSLFLAADSCIAAVSQVLVLFASGYLVLKSKMGIGQLTAVSSYMAMSLAAVRTVYGCGVTVQDCLSSVQRLSRDRGLQVDGYVRPEVVEKIDIRNLSFALGPKRLYLGKSLLFEKGKLYALVGENGAGKSTLIQLILGCYEGEFAGSVDYGDVGYREIDHAYLRKGLFSYGEQSPVLLERILAKRREVDSIGEFSLGELQQREIERVLSKKADVFVLDEPTASLDARHKEQLLERLVLLRKNKIVIVISHDQELVSIADEVIDLGSA